MKKICLLLILFSLFSGTAFALDKGQFKISTGLDYNNLDWRFNNDGELTNVNGTSKNYRLPLDVEYGILNGFDARLMLSYYVLNEGGNINNSFGQPGLGAKYMYWIFGASFDVWLPMSGGDMFDGINDTKFDVGLYAEPELGHFKINFFFNMFFDTDESSDANHVLTFAFTPSFVVPLINVSAALGVQFDYLFYPNTDFSGASYLFTLIPEVGYKLGSMIELGVEFPVSISGKNYMSPAVSPYSSSSFHHSGYGVNIKIAVLF